jgi:hypothetical protein
MLSVDVWRFSEPEQGEYDSLMSMLEGRFRNASQPTLVYVCTLRNHPLFVKVGITKAVANGLRFIDPEFGDILYDSSRDEEFNRKLGRDLPRAEAWLREQYIFRRYSGLRVSIPALKDSKWSGWTETFYAPNVSNERYILTSSANQGLRGSVAGRISRWLSIENKYTARVSDSPRADFLSGIRSLLLWSAELTPETWKQLAGEVCVTAGEKAMLSDRYSQFLHAYQFRQHEEWVEGFEEFYQNDHAGFEFSTEGTHVCEAEGESDGNDGSRWLQYECDSTAREIVSDTYLDAEDDSVGDDWY